MNPEADRYHLFGEELDALKHRTLAQLGAEDVAYVSPVGPITALDMVFGHAASIAKGNLFMAHKTGFTEDRIARLLLEARFEEVLVTKGRSYDLFALALTPAADKAQILATLRAGGLDFTA